MNRFLLVAILALATPLTGCAAVLAALPQATAIVSEVMAILMGVDSVVQTFFTTHPGSEGVRAQYLQLYDGVLTALTEYQRIAEATGDLQSGDSVAAFTKFRESYDALMNWLTTHEMRSDDGKLMLNGQALRDLPPASSFRR